MQYVVCYDIADDRRRNRVALFLVIRDQRILNFLKRLKNDLAVLDVGLFVARPLNADIRAQLPGVKDAPAHRGAEGKEVTGAAREFPELIAFQPDRAGETEFGI